jgi:hypothetical protein
MTMPLLANCDKMASIKKVLSKGMNSRFELLVLARFGVSVVPFVLGQLWDTLINPDQPFLSQP